MTSNASVLHALRGGVRRSLRQIGVRGTRRAGRDRDRRRSAERRSTAAGPAIPALPGVRVGVASGRRVRDGLAWEWSQVDLMPANWRTMLPRQPFDLVLLEITEGSVPGWGDAHGEDVAALLAWCRDHGTRCVAWVTGAVTEPDSGESWIDKVSHVFVDDPRLLEKWRARWPASHIGLLEPAAQPRIHNPRLAGGPAKRRDEAACVVVHGESVALGALDGLDSTMLSMWPADNAAAKAVHAAGFATSADPGAAPSPALSGCRVVAELGDRGAGRSWAVVEAGCAHAAVVTDGSGLAGIADDLSDLVVSSEDAESLRYDIRALVLQDELCDRQGVRLARAVRGRHTFTHRVDQIADAIGLRISRPAKTVSAIISTNRPHALGNVLRNTARQKHAVQGDLELVLVLHGFDIRTAEVEATARDTGVENLTVIQADKSLTLGACLNLGLDAAGGDFIGKMDDDNYYGSHYLTDLVAAFGYTDAGIVGKWAHYVWLRSTGAIVLRFPTAEHRYNRLVQGGSLLFKRDVARSLRFSDIPRAVDTDILNRAEADGVLTYSADRFNYVSIRGADRNDHTWPIADMALMNRSGKLVFFGDPREHVDV
jgi:Glycosyl transferase family 2